LSENGLKVVRVDCDIASILLFRIDIPSFSESIWFCAKTTRAEPNDKIELGEVLGPLHLPLGQYLGSRKILKVLMIHNNANRIGLLQLRNLSVGLEEEPCIGFTQENLMENSLQDLSLLI